jgi:predicted acetyltransferase
MPSFLAGGVAGIYHVTTLPEVRNRGIGKHITLAPLLDARENGYRVGTLFASRLGEVVYRQIGFEALSRVSVYRLRLDTLHPPSG